MTEYEGLLTATQVATLLGIRRRTWSAYVARGQAPAPVVHIGRTPLWDPAQVAAWRAGRTR